MFVPCGAAIVNWGNANFPKRSKIEAALVDGTLTIGVCMKKIGPTNVASNTFVPESPLCQNILNKFMDQKSADVAFEVGGGNLQAKTNLTSKRAKTSTTTLHAHRLILQDGAPMLAGLCKPGGEGLPTVSIPDVKPDIFIICCITRTVGGCLIMI